MSGGGTYVLISPSKDRFDDFGTKAIIDISFVSSGDIIHPPGKMLLCRRKTDVVESNASALLRRILKDKQEEIELSKALGDYEFLTVLADRDAYRKVIKALGPEAARKALEAIHDVGALAAFSSDQKDYQHLSRVAAFGQSLLRSDETFVAAWDFANLLCQNEEQAVPRENEVLRLEVPMLATDGRIEIAFSAGVLGRNRLNVFIGENGVGKTRLLKAIFEAAPRGEYHAAPKFSSVMAIPSPLDTVGLWSVDASAELSAVRTHPSVPDGWTTLTSKLARLSRDTSSESDWADIDPLSGTTTDLTLLQRALEPFLPFDDLYFPLQAEARISQIMATDIDGALFGSLKTYRLQSEARKTEFFGRIDYGRAPAFIQNEQVRILSSGERALFGLAVTLIHDMPRYGLVLLDEPELTLHPAMIATLMRLLGLLLSAREAFCIIATHSLYVIREVPKDGVHVLKKGNDGVVDYAPMPETLGAGLTELSNIVFDDWGIDEYFKNRIEHALNDSGSGSQKEVISRIESQIGEAGILAMRQILRKNRSRSSQ